MRILRSSIAISCLMAFFVRAQDKACWGRSYYAELAACSDLYSLGAVCANNAIWSIEGDIVQDLSSFGYILLGYWAMSDIEPSSPRTHRSYIYESDPYVFYGYDWHFADGWRLRNRVGIIYVFAEGYEEDVQHLIREWTFTANLKTPYVTLYNQTRHVEKLGNYVRVGAEHSIPILNDKVHLLPHISLHGGSERWNRNRYGRFVADRLPGAGLGTIDYGIRLTLPITLGFSWYFDLYGCNIIDSRTRTQVRARRRLGSTAKLDSCFALSGLVWEF